MNDPNWLLSTTAQCAAALVGIVGGFLVSRVISMAAARNSLGHRLELVEGQLDTVQRSISGDEGRLVKGDAKDFVEESTERLVEDSDVSIAELMRVGDPRGLEELQLSEYVESERAVVKEAERALVELCRSLGQVPQSIDDLKQQVAEFRLDPGKEETWGLVLRKLRREVRAARKEREEARRQEEERRNPLGLLGRPSIGIDLEDLSDSMVSPVAPGIGSGIGQRDIRRRLDEARAEAQLLRLERDKLRGEIDRLKLPGEVWVGVGVLSYFSVVGILWPVMVLADMEVVNSPNWRTWLVGAFASGLVALIAFIFYSIRKLGS